MRAAGGRGGGRLRQHDARTDNVVSMSDRDDRAERRVRLLFPELAGRSSSHVRSRQVFRYAQAHESARAIGLWLRGLARIRRGLMWPLRRAHR